MNANQTLLSFDRPEPPSAPTECASRDADRLYIIDGSGYIFRAYFAISALNTASGLPTNALFGFTRMITKLLRDIAPEYLAITFDMAAPTFRHQMYDQYKANRAECPEDLRPQMPYFRKIAQAMNISVIEKEGVEADDIIASLTRRFGDRFKGVTVVSGDKDLCQLVNDRVCVWDAMRDITYDESGVQAKFGVLPTQMVDYLTLVGDSSDNVPGIKGVGPKTAAQLLAACGSLDRVLASPELVEQVKGLRGAASLRAKLEQSREEIRLCRDLVTLRYDELPPGFEELESIRFHGLSRDALEPLLHELEFTALLKDFQFKGQAPTPRTESNKRFRVLSAEELPLIATALSSSGGFAFDTESTSLDPLSAELVGISLCWCVDEAVYLPVRSVSNPESQIPLESIRTLLGPIFADESIPKYGLNLKYDLAILRTHGIDVSNLAFDGMLASHVLHPDRRQHSLSALSLSLFAEEMLSYKDLTAGKTIDQVDLDAVMRYACADAETSFRVRTALSEELDASPGTADRSLRYAFEHVEMPLIPVLEEMERNGIRIDVELLERLSVEFAGELAELEREIYLLAGEEFNLNSPRQLSAVLFDKLGLPSAGLKRTQTSVSTDASVLSRLAPQYPIVARILEFREVFKLRSTYLESLKSLVRPDSGRVHTSFNQAVAATGRLSSSDPNLQNIPIRNARGRRIREAFFAADGWTLLSVDYSQIELRVLAHLSMDEELSQAFHRGDDIHLATARELLGGSGDADELYALRRVAKTINFGIVYGMSAFRLSQDLGIPRGQAQAYIDQYFRRYPRVKAYFAELEQGISDTGYVETMFGRRRYLSELDTSGRDKGYAIRSLLNAPIQGSAAEIMKIAMVRVYHSLKNRLDSRLVLQVHDELVVEVMQDSATEIRDLVVREMESAVALTVPLKVEAHLSQRWE